MTDLNELAIAACVKARADAAAVGIIPSIILGVKYLRDATGLGIAECKPLVEWAMPRSQSAADLPAGSVVAGRLVAYIRGAAAPGGSRPWDGTDGCEVSDSYVDGLLRDGAVVLRVGYGKEG